MNDQNKKPLKADEETEKHPLFPSGEWEGFYTYAFGPDAHRNMMSFALTFKNKTVTGSGVDNISGFSWRGHYDTEQLRCGMHKRYPTHSVFYDGYVDKNGIWGTWEIPPYSKGGFHIWPKGLSENLTVQDETTVPQTVKRPEVLNL